MNELEKEFLESYDKADNHALDDWDHIRALEAWHQEWLKRPEDLNKLLRSSNPEVWKHIRSEGIQFPGYRQQKYDGRRSWR